MIVAQHGDAAAQLAVLAQSSGALDITVAAVRAETTASRALLEGLDRDIARHGAALGDLGAYLRTELSGLRADMRQGLGAIFVQGARIEGKVDDMRTTADAIHVDVRATRAGVADLKQQADAVERARRAQQDALLDRYLRATIVRYEQVALSRFIDLKRGSGEKVPAPPASTTGGWARLR